MNIKVILEPSDEGGFTVYVPSLLGCISEGETVEEALINIKKAIELYLKPSEDDFSPNEGKHEAMLKSISTNKCLQEKRLLRWPTFNSTSAAPAFS